MNVFLDSKKKEVRNMALQIFCLVQRAVHRIFLLKLKMLMICAGNGL